MPSHISPLDGNYISLKRAAALIAREQPGIESDEVMETFKHALFAREFERREITVEGMTPAEDWNLPLLRIEAPPTRWASAPRLPIDQCPQEYLAVKGPTIADVLGERNALPGRPEDWAPFTSSPRDDRTVADALAALAHIPYFAFPTEAQALLGNIMLSRIKLRAWMAFKGYALPAFLRDTTRPAVQEPVAPPEESPARPSRGRPRKTGWARIEELIHEMHAANPETPHMTLAIDACDRAAAEFPSEELPSWETVVRHMKSILAKHLLH